MRFLTNVLALHFVYNGREYVMEFNVRLMLTFFDFASDYGNR